jgi:ATP-dependent RNA helicase CshB
MSDEKFKTAFKEYCLKQYILDAIIDLKFEGPTPIQKLVISRARKGESLMVQSATGSGKTHSFLIPIFQNLEEREKTVQALILAPTRELANQLFQVTMQIAKKCPTNVRVSCVTGGDNREDEIKRLEKTQPQIVIGTIGRIADLAISSNSLKIYSARTVVIDEADMIFEEKELLEVDKIMGLIQNKPQFLVFSATIPMGLKNFLHKYLDNIQNVTLAEPKLTTQNISHYMIQCKARNKEEVLLELMKIIRPYLCLIFVNTKERVETLALFLAEHGYKVGKLHGDMEDRDRKQTIKRIHALDYQFVVASDIAARGIDIEGVSHIINFDLPKDVEFYIHRTGRTARANATGIAYSLYAYDDDEYIRLLQSKGLVPEFLKIVDDSLVPAKLEKKAKRVSATKQIENQLHSKTPMPKKVKPSYKKKRKEKIEKEIKKAKRERIEAIYRRKARREEGAKYGENRE